MKQKNPSYDLSSTSLKKKKSLFVKDKTEIVPMSPQSISSLSPLKYMHKLHSAPIKIFKQQSTSPSKQKHMINQSVNGSYEKQSNIQNNVQVSQFMNATTEPDSYDSINYKKDEKQQENNSPNSNQMLSKEQLKALYEQSKKNNQAEISRLVVQSQESLMKELETVQSEIKNEEKMVRQLINSSGGNKAKIIEESPKINYSTNSRELLNPKKLTQAPIIKQLNDHRNGRLPYSKQTGADYTSFRSRENTLSPPKKQPSLPQKHERAKSLKEKQIPMQQKYDEVQQDNSDNSRFKQISFSQDIFEVQSSLVSKDNSFSSKIIEKDELPNLLELIQQEKQCVLEYIKQLQLQILIMKGSLNNPIEDNDLSLQSQQRNYTQLQEITKQISFLKDKDEIICAQKAVINRLCTLLG